MKYYLAPMEGITGFVFRNAYHEYFEPMDKYFTPFLSPTVNGCFTPRERRDVLPENNRVGYLVPQILCNQSTLFHKTVQELADYGYREVNLNLGCPSQTVVSKKKGAGLLADTYRLACFLDEIFTNPKVEISIKTRLGLRDAGEFAELLRIFEQYPLKELIIHARVREEFYKGHTHHEVYLEAKGKSNHELCYNGDLFCAKDIEDLAAECEQTGKKQESVMLGRGLLCNPYLVTESKQKSLTQNKRDLGRVLDFSERLLQDYASYMGEHNAMFRMKELWFYMADVFSEKEQAMKIVKKAADAKTLHRELRGLS